MTDARVTRRSRIARHLPRILLALLPVVAVISHVSGGPGWRGIDRLDTVLQDTRMRLTLPRTLDPRIVIVDIDEKSLREKDQGGEGRWPWRRDRLAQLVTDLFDTYGVSLVALDIILSERDEGSDLEVLERLAADEARHAHQILEEGCAHLIHPHTSRIRPAYVSIRQHTSADESSRRARGSRRRLRAPASRRSGSALSR
jgi:CHASE2 domain-containing sensor protein